MGDEDPFPMSRRAAGALAGDGDPFPLASGGIWVKGIATFSAFQFHPLVAVIATGAARFNFDVKLVAAPLTGLPPHTYGLFFFIPEIVIPEEKPFTVESYFFSEKLVEKIICWDAKGQHEVRVAQIRSNGLRDEAGR